MYLRYFAWQFAGKEYYKEDPKRLFKLIILVLSVLTFIGTLIYWVVTNYDLAKMIGLTQ